MYEAMKKNPFATNKGGVIKGNPDTEKVKATTIKGNDLRTGK